MGSSGSDVSALHPPSCDAGLPAPAPQQLNMSVSFLTRFLSIFVKRLFLNTWPLSAVFWPALTSVLSGSESVFPTFLVMDVPSEAAPRVEALFPEAAGF